MELKNMTRKEMIELLIQARIWECIYARNYDGLKEILLTGFVGLENFTDDELQKMLSEFDGDTIQELKEMVAEEKNREKEEIPFL